MDNVVALFNIVAPETFDVDNDVDALFNIVAPHTFKLFKLELPLTFYDNTHVMY